MKKENELAIIIKESGLEKTKADVLLVNFQDYFKIASDWESKAKTILVTDGSQKAEMQMARAGRLFLREKRIAIEKTRKKLKEQSLREGKAIDGVANVLKALIVPIEEYLDQQEHFVENKQKKEAELKRIEDEKKAEEERIAKEEAEKKEQERIRVENEKLKKEIEEKEKARLLRETKIKKEQEKAEAERKAIEDRAREEKEKAEVEKLEIAEKVRKEKEKVEKDRRVAEQKAEDEKEKLIQVLEKQIECPFCHKKFTLSKKL